jgi:hypothetical protein
MDEVSRDSLSGEIPELVKQSARTKAVRGENFARDEYGRVLRIYTNLTMNGVIPDETAWLKAQAASASGSGDGE